jgi:hypothetical protein
MPVFFDNTLSPANNNEFRANRIQDQCLPNSSNRLEVMPIRSAAQTGHLMEPPSGRVGPPAANCDVRLYEVADAKMMPILRDPLYLERQDEMQ